jgi:hypothetical protein
MDGEPMPSHEHQPIPHSVVWIQICMPDTVHGMNTDELLASTSATIGSVGSAFYFVPETLAVGKELGLDGLRWYILGRGGVLGDVDSSVISAGFGYFNPALIAKMWDSAKALLAPRDAGRRYFQCAADFGIAKFSGTADLTAYNAAAEKVIAAADRDGLSLFAGIAAEPLHDAPAARAMQLTVVLRELRGSAHLAAVLASGLRAREAHFLKRPTDAKIFGYADSDVPAPTPEAQAALAAAEVATDRIVRPAFASLSATEADALAQGAESLKAALA